MILFDLNSEILSQIEDLSYFTHR